MLAKLIMRYLKPYKFLVLAILLLEAIGAMAMLYIPRLNADIIDRGVALGDTDYIWQKGGQMLLVSLAQISATILAVYLAAKVAMRLGRDLRSQIFRRVTSFSAREVSLFGAGSLITRNTNDVQQVQMLTMMGATMLVMAPMLAVGGVVMALRQDPGLSWLIWVAVPTLLLVAGVIMSLMVPKFREFQRKLDKINQIMREQLTGIRVIRAFVREEEEKRRFNDANTEILRLGRRIGSLFVLLFPLVMLIFDTAIVGVIWFGGKEVEAGAVEVGTLFAFMAYVMQILTGVLMATFMGMMIPRAAVSADRIMEVLDTETSLHRPEPGVLDFSTPGAVSFSGVSFQYPQAEKPVLEDISFTAEPGTTLAIIGATGSGKTTLISLLPRLFDATAGVVSVSGVDVRGANIERLWQEIGYVPQRPFLFSGSIASNLRYGNEEASDSELWRALEIAQARDFVSAMPGDLSAHIAQGGTNVSGGQRQRLAIARAIVRKPNVLIFDDSFSALDLTTDARVRQALWRELPGVTKIVVAQRVSTIAEADQILVLDGGTVVGLGKHGDLLKHNRTYQEIVNSQLAVEA